LPPKALSQGNRNNLIGLGVEIEKVLEDEETSSILEVFKRYSNISTRYISGRVINQKETKKELDKIRLDLWKRASEIESEKLNSNLVSYYLKWILAKEFRTKKKAYEKINEELYDSSLGLTKEELAEKHKEKYEIVRDMRNLGITINKENITIVLSAVMIILMIITIVIMIQNGYPQIIYTDINSS